MRTHGTLIKWNDDRGFGFIEPTVGDAEIFVHVSAFPRDGVRPHVGELVSFDVEVRKDGKRQAVHVMRPGTTRRSPRSRAASHGSHRQGSWAGVGAALLLAAIFAWVYFSERHASSRVSNEPAALVAPSAAPAQRFHCDGRTTCSQMTSCAEAKYFLDRCPSTKMDGNGDGVPCQSQWCGSSHESWR